MQKLYDYGMFVTAGYIIGFDSERGSVSQGILELIEASDTAANMVGLLYALPGTQLSRRLVAEGRLHEHLGYAGGAESIDLGDQCLARINFRPIRSRPSILLDYRRVISDSYAPAAYFARVGRMATRLNCSKKQLSLPWRNTLHDLLGFARLIVKQGILASSRRYFWCACFTWANQIRRHCDTQLA